MKKIGCLASIFSFVLLLAGPVSAGEPTAQLSATINEFVNILVNTPVAQLRASGLPEKALSLVYSRFDFSEMTKRCLGSHWDSLGNAEQREFVDAFTQRILRAYGRSVRASGDEKVQYSREMQDGDLATVETKVISGKGEELPVDYQLHDVGGQWKVYDVVIDQVSIVSNYRAQFERVIAKSSVKELLQRVKQQQNS
ncbi:MAG TPA: ABC transporter substrate-binding protein [Candidatus Binatia bacterium]|jgi:phospholipid transport system substrate-binding protein